MILSIKNGTRLGTTPSLSDAPEYHILNSSPTEETYSLPVLVVKPYETPVEAQNHLEIPHIQRPQPEERLEKCAWTGKQCMGKELVEVWKMVV